MQQLEMTMKPDPRYIHIELTSRQTPRKPDAVCGDLMRVDRTPEAVNIVVSDGMGSGLRANIAAELGTTRLLHLMRSGFTMRQAFAQIVHTMRAAPEADLPYAVFTALRILPDGHAAILSFEMPAPVLIAGRHTSLITMRPVTVDNEVFLEGHFPMQRGDHICIVSDGISQAGLGNRFPMGWGMERICNFMQSQLDAGISPERLPDRLVDTALKLSQGTTGDDCTAVLVSARAGRTLTILTGPPADPANTPMFIRRFLNADGMKVVCGATTADLVARELGRPIRNDPLCDSMVAPPHYELEGIDLVTEGAVTLNQAYRILTENPAEMEEHSGVTELCQLLLGADRIQIFAGLAVNPAHNSIAFRQLGILPRQKILPLLHKKLTAIGKLVLIEWL